MKQLYRELELEDVYAKYEEETHSQIKELIAKVDDIPHAVSFASLVRGTACAVSAGSVCACFVRRTFFFFSRKWLRCRELLAMCSFLFNARHFFGLTP